MASFVEPKTFLIGATALNKAGMVEYLQATGQTDFLVEIEKAEVDGLGHAEALCSFYAKLCYASLVPGKNDNLTRVRSIAANVMATLDSGHGSVFEHVNLNFVTTDCSRVLTHELVRHRAGTAFSQTSGRYVRTDEIRLVLDPILEPIREVALGKLQVEESWYLHARVMMGLSTPEELAELFKLSRDPAVFLSAMAKVKNYKVEVVGDEVNVTVEPLDFETKKKVTSALRRFLPEGRANEIGWSVNIRQLRHMIMLRTSRHAEWEIRKVFDEVFGIVNRQYNLLFHDARVEIVDGLREVSGMRLQPYDKSSE